MVRILFSLVRSLCMAHSLSIWRPCLIAWALGEGGERGHHIIQHRVIEVFKGQLGAVACSGSPQHITAHHSTHQTPQQWTAQCRTAMQDTPLTRSCLIAMPPQGCACMDGHLPTFLHGQGDVQLAVRTCPDEAQQAGSHTKHSLHS